MNITQLSEQLKDIPQNTLIGYAKNPNSVVPQFLALAEIQRRQQLQTPAQAPSSTVANDVLAQANPQPAPQQMPQQMPQPAPQMQPQGLAQLAQQAAPEQMARQLPENQPGVSQLASRVAPQGFAGGGIVAFAGGGMPAFDPESDQDYEDYVEQTEKAKRRSRLDTAMESVNNRVAGVMGMVPRSYDEAKSGFKTAASHGMDDLKSLLHKVGMLESGNKDYDKNGRLITSPKGAEGRMQTLRSTQRDPGFGVTPARDSSVEEKNRVGEDYFKAMLDKFQDPKIAAMAYNWGPGNVQKWLESDRKMPIPQETVKYASHFAKGGIAHFAKGSMDEPIKASDYYASSEADDRMFAAPTKVGIDSLNASYEDADKYRSVTPAVTKTPAAPLDRFEQFIQQRQAEQEELKANKKQDAALAILQAGLGMMGGTSPYAFANIGQGGQQGIAAYGNLSKQRGAELAASRKAEGNALEGQILSEIKRSDIERRALQDKDLLAEKAAGRTERSQILNTKEENDKREAALARFNSDPEIKKLAGLGAEAQAGSIQQQYYQEMMRIKRNNAFAEAGVPGFKMITALPAFPTERVEPSWWSQNVGTPKFGKEDLEALKWANDHPLDPMSNQIKERFK